jgi:hypothetical protein
VGKTSFDDLFDEYPEETKTVTKKKETTNAKQSWATVGLGVNFIGGRSYVIASFSFAYPNFQRFFYCEKSKQPEYGILDLIVYHSLLLIKKMSELYYCRTVIRYSECVKSWGKGGEM